PIADPEQEREPFPQRLVRGRYCAIGAAVEDQHAVSGGLVSEFADQPRLAGACLAREQHEAALAALGTLERRPQRRELVFAADKRKRRHGYECGGQRYPSVHQQRPVTGEVERGVLSEDLL